MAREQSNIISGEEHLTFGGQSQQAFLDRLRAARGTKPATEDHPGSTLLPSDIETRFTWAEKAELFINNLEGLGGRVLRADTIETAYLQIADVLKDRDAGRVLVSGGDWSAFEDVMNRIGIGVDYFEELDFQIGGADRALERANEWDAGINRPDYAIADLGGVAVISSDEQSRSVSLVPPLYIALVTPNKLVYSRYSVLSEVSARSRQSGPPSSLTFISGPSRSADIEMDLSIGVHGPGEMIAVLIEQDGETES